MLHVTVFMSLIAVAKCETCSPATRIREYFQPDQLNCNVIRALVDGHNSRRLMLANGQVPNQPAASAMHALVWDEELTRKAEDWASRNIYSHNPNRDVPSKRFSTGENYIFFYFPDFNFELDLNAALDFWFNEYKDFTYKPLTLFDFEHPAGVQIGHYTQMAWWNTTNIGCGVINIFENELRKYLLVCNYGPGGNLMNQAPYPAGPPSGELICSTENCNRPYGPFC